MAAELPNFKKFVSEDDIAEAKKKRQEEWEKVRQPHQPEEAPEEVYDPRSLFERLEANKTKKQEEFDEAHRLKNMVRGLENDEIDFLETVSRHKEQEEQDKYIEEKLLLAEYKSSLVYDRTAEQEEEIKSVAKKPANKPLPLKPIKSQKSLLAGVIKKKRLSSESEAVPAKKSKQSDEPNQKVTVSASSDQGKEPADTSISEPSGRKTGALGALAGLGDYSDSESDDS